MSCHSSNTIQSRKKLDLPTNNALLFQNQSQCLRWLKNWQKSRRCGNKWHSAHSYHHEQFQWFRKLDQKRARHLLWRAGNRSISNWRRRYSLGKKILLKEWGQLFKQTRRKPSMCSRVWNGTRKCPFCLFCFWLLLMPCYNLLVKVETDVCYLRDKWKFGKAGMHATGLPHVGPM